MSRPELVFVCQYKLGGVQNYYQNLLRANKFEDFDTRVIYTNNLNDPESRLKERFNCAGEEIVFDYNEGDPVYHTFRRLARHISNKAGMVFTNFPLELGCIHNNEIAKTVAYVVHDEWYIQNAIRYGFLIDVYIAHNPGIFDLLLRIMPDRKDDIYYLPYGIDIPGMVRKENADGPLRILFTGRLHSMKGIFDIPLIDDVLKRNGITAKWTIIGDGPDREQFFGQIGNRNNFSHHTPATNREVLEIAARQDVFVLPSRLEGMPVSLIEAMSVGLVPVIADFNEGIKRVVTSDIGFIHQAGDIEGFAQTIVQLDKNRSLVDTMGGKAHLKVMNDFDAKKNAERYYELARKYKALKSPRRSRLPVDYGNGRLDKPYMPSIFLKTIRRLKP